MFDMEAMATPVRRVLELSLDLVRTGKSLAMRHKNCRYRLFFVVVSVNITNRYDHLFERGDRDTSKTHLGFRHPCRCPRRSAPPPVALGPLRYGRPWPLSGRRVFVFSLVSVSSSEC